MQLLLGDMVFLCAKRISSALVRSRHNERTAAKSQGYKEVWAKAYWNKVLILQLFPLDKLQSRHKIVNSAQSNGDSHPFYVLDSTTH